MELRRQEGFPYSFDPDACSRCPGRCCRGRSGRIWVSLVEIDRIASYLKTNRVDFMNRAVRQTDNRLSLQERWTASEALCLFFDLRARKCRIYPVRPAQCRHYPFWDHFRDNAAQLAAACPGVRL